MPIVDSVVLGLHVTKIRSCCRKISCFDMARASDGFTWISYFIHDDDHQCCRCRFLIIIYARTYNICSNGTNSWLTSLFMSGIKNSSLHYWAKFAGVEHTRKTNLWERGAGGGVVGLG
jgi:hypothetical protein